MLPRWYVVRLEDNSHNHAGHPNECIRFGRASVADMVRRKLNLLNIGLASRIPSRLRVSLKIARIVCLIEHQESQQSGREFNAQKSRDSKVNVKRTIVSNTGSDWPRQLEEVGECTYPALDNGPLLAVALSRRRGTAPVCGTITLAFAVTELSGSITFDQVANPPPRPGGGGKKW